MGRLRDRAGQARGAGADSCGQTEPEPRRAHLDLLLQVFGSSHEVLNLPREDMLRGAGRRGLKTAFLLTADALQNPPANPSLLPLSSVSAPFSRRPIPLKQRSPLSQTPGTRAPEGVHRATVRCDSQMWNTLREAGEVPQHGGRGRGREKASRPSQSQWAPRCEAAPASGLWAPLRREGGHAVRAGQPGLGATTGRRPRGLTCQQHQQLPQGTLVQVQGILLPTSLLLLRPQTHRVAQGHAQDASCPTWIPGTRYRPWPWQPKPLPGPQGAEVCPGPSLGGGQRLRVRGGLGFTSGSLPHAAAPPAGGKGQGLRPGTRPTSEQVLRRGPLPQQGLIGGRDDGFELLSPGHVLPHLQAVRG